MKIVHLTDRWIQKLANLPESGMGYQRVDFFLKNNRLIQDVMVFNAEEAQAEEDFDPDEIQDVRIHH